MKNLYEPYNVYNSGFLDVGSGHKLYYEESGNKLGIPLVYIHGGPGSKSKPEHRQIFNPKKYHVIQYDQRGCGKSKYISLLKDNNTECLVNDLEKLKKHLKISRWMVNGFSWGSTLALAYSIKYSHSVEAMILEGIFLARKLDFEFIYNLGANQLFPEYYEKFRRYFEIEDFSQTFAKIGQRVNQEDFELSYQAAKSMFEYEAGISVLETARDLDDEVITKDEKQTTINSAKISLHYNENDFFINDKYILSNIYKLKNIPAVIIQGRYDLLCPYINAWNLHLAWPEAEFITTIAGHYSKDEENLQNILKYTGKFSKSRRNG